MATGRTNSGEVTITQSGGEGSSDVQPRKVDYIWMQPSSLFKIEKDFLGWLNSGYEISIKYRLNTEYVNSANYSFLLGCKFKDSTSDMYTNSYGYYLGNSNGASITMTYRQQLMFSANLSNTASTSVGTYRNNMIIIRVNNNTIQYKNCYSHDYNYNTWTIPTNWSSLTIPDNNTFSSLLNIYDSITGVRDFFGYGGLIQSDGSFRDSIAIIGNLKVTNPSNNDEVIVNYETWIDDNTPYLKETVSNTTVSAVFGSSVAQSDRFNGWIEYVTDENGIVTRKEVPPKKYVQTRGNIVYVDEIEDGNENENNNR